MIDVDLPEDDAVPELTRSFAPCMASATETPAADVPQPCADLPGATAHWRSWLASRGSGLVAIAKPASFNWPGYWLAVVGEPGANNADAAAVLMFGTRRVPAAAAERHGRSARRGNAGQWRHAHRASSQAIANRGLDGDRYAAKAGTFTPTSDTARGYDLTLIEAEVLDTLTLPDGRSLGYAEARRNVVTHGIRLSALVGRRFRIGDVECLGQRPCEPCSRLERLTEKGTLRALIHQGGLRADVLEDGEITTGDLIETVD